MKGIPSLFNDIIRKQLKVYAAWLPITNNLKLGDYGIISGDIFEPIGNIKDDFGISFDEVTGPEASIDFKSAGTRVLKFAGGAKVNVIPARTVDAKVNISFDKESSFLIQSPSIQVTSIPNPNAIAKKIIDLKEWERKYKVVYKILHATEAVIISTIDSGTEISFTGDLEALNNVQLGHAGLSFASNKSTGLKTIGKEGVIGLGLFRIKDGIFSKPDIDILRGAKKGMTKTKRTSIDIELNEGSLLKNDL